MAMSNIFNQQINGDHGFKTLTATTLFNHSTSNQSEYILRIDLQKNMLCHIFSSDIVRSDSDIV